MKKISQEFIFSKMKKKLARKLFGSCEKEGETAEIISTTRELLLPVQTSCE